MWAPAVPVSVPTATASQVLKIFAGELGTLEGRNADGTRINIQPYGAWYGANG
jgi:hypothetical protein